MAFLLLGAKFRQIGLAADEGVEIILRRSFVEKNKPIEALETNVEQLGYFDRLPEDAQRAMLEGAIGSDIMFVGEQPGDMEDLTGRPFTGPAGQLLNGVMDEVGIIRNRAYVTNAVKHFKFEPRGKRRIH